ncbi:MAG TPA: site-specific integrase [Candidatus Baltobacterales bacterium]|nr:site-specific integrase [Candidatus Baltobacterales bacterium]
MTGPLTAHAAGFAAELSRVGYTENSTADQVRLLAHLSRWLSTRKLDVTDLTPAVGTAFLAMRRAAGYRLWLSPKALEPLLRYLQRLGALPPEPVVTPTPSETLLARYREYLTSKRGLTSSTAAGYILLVRSFLRKWERPDGTLELQTLAPRDVTGYLMTDVVGHGSAKLIVTSLRSFLSFLHVEGKIAQPLSSAVPSVASTRLAGLPRALEPGHVQRLLATCDRRTIVGRRDFAVMTMLVRLGLRAGEVAALDLEDVDWRSGDLIVRGKGDRRERLPLPEDVGRAVTAYLKRGRSACDSRRVFLRVRAPHRGLTSGGITAIVIGASLKAGLPPVAAHRLRHTAATAMLRAGASLQEIGQVLRHRSPLSTAIYAKVDRDALRQLARPWPVGGAA